MLKPKFNNFNETLFGDEVKSKHAFKNEIILQRVIYINIIKN